MFLLITQDGYQEIELAENKDGGESGDIPEIHVQISREVVPDGGQVEQSVEYVSLLQDPDAADTVNQILGSVEGKDGTTKVICAGGGGADRELHKFYAIMGLRISRIQNS